MFRKNKHPQPSPCLSIEMLLRHVIQPEGLTEQQCDAVTDHLAQHWQVECPPLSQAVGGPSAELPAEGAGSVRDGTYMAEGRRKALSRWRQDIDDAKGGPEGLSGGLLMFSLRAGTYLANTLTAAFMWFETHPESLAGGAEGMPAAVAQKEQADFLAELRRQTEAAQDGVMVVQDLITAPKPAGCQDQTTALTARLLERVGALSGMDAGSSTDEERK